MAAYVLIWESEGRRIVRIILFGIQVGIIRSFDFVYHSMFTLRIKTGRFMDRICLCFRQKSWCNTQSFGPDKKRCRVPETLV
jgi:hypothetical protein